MLVSRIDEAPEEGMRRVGLGEELRMELRRDKERMPGDLDQLHEPVVRRRPGEHKPRLGEGLAVPVVELEPVPVALMDQVRPVEFP